MQTVCRIAFLPVEVVEAVDAVWCCFRGVLKTLIFLILKDLKTFVSSILKDMCLA